LSENHAIGEGIAHMDQVLGQDVARKKQGGCQEKHVQLCACHKSFDAIMIF
jgi:hypothetical protein